MVTAKNASFVGHQGATDGMLQQPFPNVRIHCTQRIVHQIHIAILVQSPASISQYLISSNEPELIRQ